MRGSVNVTEVTLPLKSATPPCRTIQPNRIVRPSTQDTVMALATARSGLEYPRRSLSVGRLLSERSPLSAEVVPWAPYSQRHAGGGRKQENGDGYRELLRRAVGALSVSMVAGASEENKGDGRAGGAFSRREERESSLLYWVVGVMC